MKDTCFVNWVLLDHQRIFFQQQLIEIRELNVLDTEAVVQSFSAKKVF